MIHVRQGPRVWRNLTLLEVFLDMLLHGAQPHLHELFGQLLVLLSVAGKLRIFEASKACFFFFSGKSAFFQTRGLPRSWLCSCNWAFQLLAVNLELRNHDGAAVDASNQSVRSCSFSRLRGQPSPRAWNSWIQSDPKWSKLIQLIDSFTVDDLLPGLRWWKGRPSRDSRSSPNLHIDFVGYDSSIMNRVFCGPIGTFWASVNVVVRAARPESSTFGYVYSSLGTLSLGYPPATKLSDAIRIVLFFFRRFWRYNSLCEALSLHANWDNTLAASTQYVLVATVGSVFTCVLLEGSGYNTTFHRPNAARARRARSAKWCQVEQMRGELRRPAEIEPTPRIGVWGHAFSDMEMAYDLLRWCDIRLRSRSHRRADAQGSPTKELGEWGKAALERLTSAHARLLHVTMSCEHFDDHIADAAVVPSGADARRAAGRRSARPLAGQWEVLHNQGHTPCTGGGAVWWSFSTRRWLHCQMPRWYCKSLCIPTLIAGDRWKLEAMMKTHNAQLPTRNSSPEAGMYIETDLLVNQVVASWGSWGMR